MHNTPDDANQSKGCRNGTGQVSRFCHFGRRRKPASAGRDPMETNGYQTQPILPHV